MEEQKEKQKTNEFVTKEVEKINGYYKKIILEPVNPTFSSRTKLEGLALKVFNNRYSLKDKQGKRNILFSLYYLFRIIKK